MKYSFDGWMKAEGARLIASYLAHIRVHAGARLNRSTLEAVAMAAWDAAYDQESSTPEKTHCTCKGYPFEPEDEDDMDIDCPVHGLNVRKEQGENAFNNQDNRQTKYWAYDERGADGNNKHVVRSEETIIAMLRRTPRYQAPLPGRDTLLTDDELIEEYITINWAYPVTITKNAIKEKAE